MNFETLGNIGDFLGGIAVLATLIYLAIQIRGNTRAAQSENRAGVAREYMAVMEPESDPKIAKIFGEGLRNYPDIAHDDLVRYSAYMNRQSLFFQGVYARYETGQLEDETYKAYLDWYSCLIATPGGALWFDDIARPIYVPSMVAVVDSRIRRGGLVDATTLPAYQVVKNDT
ncbi:MAG: hypothetical protein ACI9NT_000499 [Bacteroidia bacterium]|jgi:hypothetical protein